MIADKESRLIVFSEEYLPRVWYDCLCKNLNLTPTIDVMATLENAKCDDFIYFFKSPGIPNKTQRDFFAVSDLGQHKTGYCYPPKKLLTRTLNHIYQNFRHMNWIIIFHVFLEWPIGLEQFRLLKNVAVTKAPEDMFTIIPSEKKIEIQNQTYIGMRNKWAKSTHILTHYAHKE